MFAIENKGMKINFKKETASLVCKRIKRNLRKF
jgi:hypothetical protein